MAEEVREFLAGNNLQEYAAVIIQEGGLADMDKLERVKDADLARCGLPAGARLRFFQGLGQLRTDSSRWRKRSSGDAQASSVRAERSLKSRLSLSHQRGVLSVTNQLSETFRRPAPGAGATRKLIQDLRTKVRELDCDPTGEIFDEFRRFRQGAKQLTAKKRLRSLYAFLGLDYRDYELGSNQRKFMEGAVWEAAGCLNVPLLDVFLSTGMWRPHRHGGHAICGASAEGHLLQLLEAYTLPLDEFPHLVPDAVAMYLRHLSGWRPVQSQRPTKLGPARGSTWKPEQFGRLHVQRALGAPHPSRLLCNILMTPGPSAALLFEGIVEEVIVPRPSELEDGKNARPWPRVRLPSHRFPDSMPTLFLRRKIPSWMENEFIHTDHGPDAFGELRSHRGRSRAIKTHPKTQARVMQDGKLSHFPQEAIEFCHIYACVEGRGEFPHGGFAYFGGSDSRIPCINEITTELQHHAIVFGRFQRLRPEISKALRKHSVPTIDPHMASAGARDYAWVNPGTDIRGLFNAGLYGGFAFFFEDPSDDRFFPMAGITAVSARARLRGEMQAGELDHYAPDGIDIFEGLRLESKIVDTRPKTCSRRFRRWLVKYVLPGGRPTSHMVAYKRILIPDLTTPWMLFAIANAHEPSAVTTEACRAIVSVAWAEAFLYHAVVVFSSFSCVIGHMLLILSLRNVVNEEIAVASRLGALAITMAFWQHSAWNLMLFFHYRRRRWRFLTSPRRIKDILRLLLQFALLVQLSTNTVDRPNLLRLLLVAGSLVQWLDFLTALRPVEALGIGRGVLPIMHAFSDVVPIVFVGALAIIAFAQASLAISAKSFAEALFSAYMTGAMGEVDVNRDVRGVQTASGASLPFLEIGGAQFIAFGFLTFVVALGMANIFISAMGVAYQRYTERSLELLLRERALLACDYKVLIKYLNWLSQLLFGEARGPRTEWTRGSCGAVSTTATEGGSAESSEAASSRTLSASRYVERSEVEFNSKFIWFCIAREPFSTTHGVGGGGCRGGGAEQGWRGGDWPRESVGTGIGAGSIVEGPSGLGSTGGGGLLAMSSSFGCPCVCAGQIAAPPSPSGEAQAALRDARSPGAEIPRPGSPSSTTLARKESKVTKQVTLQTQPEEQPAHFSGSLSTASGSSRRTSPLGARASARSPRDIGRGLGRSGEGAEEHEGEGEGEDQGEEDEEEDEGGADEAGTSLAFIVAEEMGGQADDLSDGDAEKDSVHEGKSDRKKRSKLKRAGSASSSSMKMAATLG